MKGCLKINKNVYFNPSIDNSLKLNMIKEYDLCDFVCPLSKIKAAELIDNLADKETVKIILGDTDSLKSVAQELKTRGIKPGFEQEAENRFILTITK